MRKKDLPPWKRLTFSLILWLIFGLILILAGEALIRVVVYFISKKYPTRTTVADKEWGHRVRENFHWEGTVRDANGQDYELKYTTDNKGFRAFGDPDSDKKKVLFIGDSFTEAIEVSDDKTYFSLLGDSLDFEIFAYGCRGFGTLQEYLLLEKYLPDIQPDLVVLQFCSNDFINNFYELEKYSLYNNNRRRRPYLTENNEIVFHVPAKVGWDWLNERSLFFQFLFTRLERFLDHRAPESAHSEYHLTKKGMAYPPFAESLERTGRILTMFKEKLLPESKLLIFTTHQDYPYFDAIGELCQNLDIPFVGDIPRGIEALEITGRTTRAKDGAHWNELGHKVATEVLAPQVVELLDLGIIEN